MIYFPYSDVKLNAECLVRQDLVRQVDEIMNFAYEKRGVPPEWIGHQDALIHIGLIYVNTLRNKHAMARAENSKTKDGLTKKLRGTLTLPPWCSDPKLNKYHQGYLKFIGLGRLYFWKYHKQVPVEMLKNPEKLLKYLDGVTLPLDVRADYSQFDVPLQNVPIRHAE